MLTELSMKAGPTPGQSPLKISLTPVTIFVGPNNSGKSRALLEIENWVRNANPPEGVVIESVGFASWTEEEIQRAVDALEVRPRLNESLNPDHVMLCRVSAQTNASSRFQIHKPILLKEAQNPNGKRSRYSSFLSLFTLKLDGANRLALTNAQEAGDLQKDPPNHLAHLFQNNDARKKLSDAVYDAFEKYLVVDPTGMKKLRLRLSARPPVDEQEERGWDSKAQAFHKAAIEIEQTSDGVKAFVGILSTIIAGDPKITLIDEPEAFLHPSLSARLGKEVAASLAGTNRRLFVSTHSSSFLMGCIQAGAEVNIVRLTYDYESATARLLAKDRLTPLMRNPLLRSAGVLDGLFYRAVVVTESDTDRAFYQEVNERLLAAKDPRGVAGCLFLNAQNKQTVWDIVRPLRELGIPAAGVVDIDVLKEGGAVWKKPLEGAFLPPLSHDSLGTQRASLAQAFEASGKNMKRDGGTSILEKSDQESCRNLLDQLSEYGVFVVATGEVESWLTHLDIKRNKGKWLLSVFEAMGEDPSSPDYVRPGAGDVWDFLGRIQSWASNAKRKGIPE